jgi:signal transduction histidine kinase
MLVAVRDPTERADTSSPPSAARLAAAHAMSAGLAHELRNVLAVAESALFLARREVDQPASARLARHLDQASAEIRRAQDTIGAVLALARGEATRREPVPVAQLIGAARAGLRSSASVRFVEHLLPEGLSVLGDPVLLVRVFANLYMNAVTALAARDHGTVTTSAALVEDRRVELVVEDDGPGIDPAIAARLFEPLASSAAGGTGLGLFLCKAIIEAHGGAIAANPRSGGGAVFSFWLPAA